MPVLRVVFRLSWAWRRLLQKIRTSAARFDSLMRKGEAVNVGERGSLTLAAVQAWRRWRAFTGSGAAVLRGTGAQQPCWGQGATPIGGLRAAVLIGSRVKRLAQLELMPASTRTGYYLTQHFAGLAALPPSPARNIFAGRRKNV